LLTVRQTFRTFAGSGGETRQRTLTSFHVPFPRFFKQSCRKKEKPRIVYLIKDVRRVTYITVLAIFPVLLANFLNTGENLHLLVV